MVWAVGQVSSAHWVPVFGQVPAAVKANTPPLRLGIIFFSNGVEPIHWWAKGSGAAMELKSRMNLR